MELGVVEGVLVKCRLVAQHMQLLVELMSLQQDKTERGIGKSVAA